MPDVSERPTLRRLRALRGTVAAAVAVLFASTAHTLSGGHAPPAWLVVAIVVLAAPLCVGLIGRRRTLPRLAATIGAAQLALHGAFAAIGDAAPAGGLGHAAHHHTPLALDASTFADPAAATMTVGHAIAALATLVVLAWGEHLMVAIARGIRRLLRLPVAPMLPSPHAPLPSAPATAPHAAAVFLDCLSRRGPPTRPASALTA